MCLGLAQLTQGDLAGAVAHFSAMVAEAEAGHYDELLRGTPSRSESMALALARRSRLRHGPRRRCQPRGRRRVWRHYRGPCLLQHWASAALAAGDARDRAGRDRGGLAARQNVPPGSAAHLRPIRRPGRAGQRGSCRGRRCGRRGGHDRDRMLLDVGADHPRASGDRAGRAGSGRARRARRADVCSRIGCAPVRSRHLGVPRRRGRRCRQSPRSRPPFRRGRRHPAAHGRGALQGLGRRLRSLGGDPARYHGQERL